jgi:hypothetical protein
VTEGSGGSGLSLAHWQGRELPTDRSKFSALKIGSLAQTSNPRPPIQYCLDGEAATGLAGRYGKHVNAAGLICDKLVR